MFRVTQPVMSLLVGASATGLSYQTSVSPLMTAEGQTIAAWCTVGITFLTVVVYATQKWERTRIKTESAGAKLTNDDSRILALQKDVAGFKTDCLRCHAETDKRVAVEFTKIQKDIEGIQKSLDYLARSGATVESFIRAVRKDFYEDERPEHRSGSSGGFSMLGHLPPEDPDLG